MIMLIFKGPCHPGAGGIENLFPCSAPGIFVSLLFQIKFNNFYKKIKIFSLIHTTVNNITFASHMDLTFSVSPSFVVEIQHIILSQMIAHYQLHTAYAPEIHSIVILLVKWEHGH